MNRVRGCVCEGIQVWSEPLYVLKGQSTWPGPVEEVECNGKQVMIV